MKVCQTLVVSIIEGEVKAVNPSRSYLIHRPVEEAPVERLRNWSQSLSFDSPSDRQEADAPKLGSEGPSFPG